MPTRVQDRNSTFLSVHDKQPGGVVSTIPLAQDSLFGTGISRSRPIGIFDSGLGGLTVVRAVRKLLPTEDIVYMGDLARLPYGIKSAPQIIACSKHNTEFLLNHRVKALVVACNSSASTSLDILHNYYRLPLIVDVIRPAAAEAFRRTRNGRVGLLGTLATVRAGRHEKLIGKMDGTGKVKVFSEAAPLLVPLVESGWVREKVTKDVIRRYVRPLLERRIDTLILACTHYPMLKPAIRECVGPDLTIIDSGPLVAESLMDGLRRRGLLAGPNGRAGTLKIYVTDMPQDFRRMGEWFLGEKLTHVKTVSWP